MKPTEQARTTVVIATKDRHEELVRTLEHLRALRPRPPIVVVDNGSRDGTAALVRERFPDVRLCALDRNLAAAARTIGVREARTPYIAFSDDDSWWAPDALPRAERAFDTHPRLGLVAATPLVGPDNRPDPVTEALAGSPLGTRPGDPGPSVLGFLACAALVRRDAYLDVGGFSPLLHFGAEETLLSYDLAARGWSLCYLDEVCAHHHPSPNRLPAARRRALEIRNNLLIHWLRRPTGVAARRTAAVAAEAVGDPVARSAFLAATGKFPVTLRRRRVLPPEIEVQVRRLADDDGRRAA